jgi:PAS domain S-box-containing protein
VPGQASPSQSSTKQIIGYGLLVIAIIWFLIAWTLLQGRLDARRSAEVATANLSQILADSFGATVKEIDLGLQSVQDEIARQQKAGISDEAAINDTLDRQSQRQPELLGFRIFGADGTLRYGFLNIADRRGNIENRDYFIFHRDHRDGGLFVGPAEFGLTTKQWRISVSRRISNADGSFGGVVICSIPTHALSESYGKLALGSKGSVALIHQSFKIASRFPEEKSANPNTGGTTASTAFQAAVQSGAQPAYYEYTSVVDGIHRLGAVQQIGGTPYYQLVAVSEDDYLADWRHSRTWLLGTGMILTGLVIGVALIMSQRAIRQAVADRQLHESEESFRALFSDSPDAYLIMALEGGRILECNRASESMLRGRREEILGKTPDEISPPAQPDGRTSRESVPEKIEAALAKGLHRFEWVHRRLDGEDFWAEITISVSVYLGQPVLLVAWRDISDRKRAEKALEQALRDAEAANQAKSRFLATMSHEIRTPMNGVLGMAQMLLTPEVSNKEREEFARIILNSGQTLLTLLNDILDLSKVEAGKFELQPAVFMPDQLIKQVDDLFGESARSKGLSIEAEWHGVPQQRYRADSNRLRQMLSNLIGNAIKFTQHGFIRVDGLERKREGDEAILEFSVTDSGIGIPADKRPLLFQPFSQIDGSITREFGGTGLGLSIVRSLANMMGGQVGVESEVGKGARFWFTITSQVVAEDEESRRGQRVPSVVESSASTGARTSPPKVLVVEDNLVNTKVISVMLQKQGCEVHVFDNGRKALDTIVEGQWQPDLVFMDVQMPEMDGLEATRRIREWETTCGKSRLPIVALTAGAFQEDQKHCIEAGMDDFLAKPIVARDLVQVLTRWLKEGPAMLALGE